MNGWCLTSLDRIHAEDGWLPIRRELGVHVVGINGWLGREAGDEVIGAHTEARLRHEELYVVLRGRATFTIAGDEVDAPAGTLVFVRDPDASRAAVAAEADTLVVALGAAPGVAYEPSRWEWNARAFVPYRRGDHLHALELFRQAHDRFPDDGGFLYNIACVEALLGRREDALEHLRRAYELGADANALEDDDFASLRDDPRFREIAGGRPEA